MAVTRVSQSTVKEGLEKSNSFLVGIPPILGRYESIQTIVVGSSGATDVTFSNITGTYQHLQLRALVRETNRSDANSDLALQFNANSTAADYAIHFLVGNGVSTSAGAETGRGNVGAYRAMTADNATASVFGAAIIDILDYASSSKNKVVRSFQGYDQNGAGLGGMTSGLWLSTNAITSIKVFSHYSPGKLAQYSHLALYGIKAP